MFVVSRNKRRSKADNQTDKNCMLQYSSLSAKENLYCSTAPPIYFQSILQACIIIIISCQLPSHYDTDTETTSQDPNYNICSTHAIYFCRGD